MVMAVLLAVTGCLSVNARAAEPVQDQGVTIKFFPPSLTGKGGYEVLRAGSEVAKPGQLQFEKYDELYKWVRALPRDMVRNGVWIITLDPSAYPKSQLDDFELLKTELGRSRVAIFTCLEKDLPGGWKKAD